MFSIFLNDIWFVYLELLRENKRMIDKSIREIERERQGLQTQEKKLIAEIKKSAKQGQMVSKLIFFHLLPIYLNALIISGPYVYLPTYFFPQIRW